MAYYLFNFTKKAAQKGRPLSEQARELLSARLWGIGAKTANRDLLAPGDIVLAYVGAPERVFVGQGTLASGVHVWTPDEAARYPGDWDAGVAFAETTLLDPPVGLASVWSRMPSSKPNPNAQFFGGVVRIKEEDFAIAAGQRGLVKPPDVTPAVAQSTTELQATGAEKQADEIFAVAERLRDVLAKSPALSEEATRALLINRLLDALGYTQFGDVDFGVPVDSGDFADYVVTVGGVRTVCVEAKKLGATLAAKEAAQVVKYTSVLGMRWGIVTDGRLLKLYDARLPNVPPESRLVFELDLAGYVDREDFDVRIYPDLALLRKEALISEALERRAAREALRDLLTTPDSQTVAALKNELKVKKLMPFDSDELVDLVGDVLA